MGGRILLVTAVLGLAAATATAGPKPHTAARRLLDGAVRLFAAGELQRAHSMLERARSLAGDSAVLAQIYLHLGLIEAAHGDEKQAQALFERALERDWQLQLDDRRHRPDFVRLFERVRDRGEGTLLVVSDPPGDVWIDGRRVGQTPLRRRLFRGRYTVAVRLPDRRSRSSLLVLRPARTAAVDVTFDLPVASRGRASKTAATEVVARPAPDVEQRSYAWTWLAGGAAALAAAVATGLTVSALSDERAGCELLLVPPQRCDERTTLRDPGSEARYLQLRDAVERKQLGATVSWSLAATLAVSSLLLYWLQQR